LNNFFVAYPGEATNRNSLDFMSLLLTQVKQQSLLLTQEKQQSRLFGGVATSATRRRGEFLVFGL